MHARTLFTVIPIYNRRQCERSLRSLPERYNETSVLPGSERGRERKGRRGKEWGVAGKKEDAIWAEVRV